MIAGARYGHTNLIADDWRALSRFYQDLFGCIPVPPERDFKGPDLERGTGIAGAELRGEHLRLPGHGPEGPTLEIKSRRWQSIGRGLATSHLSSTMSRLPGRPCLPPEDRRLAKWSR
jgi:hypothetical protein